MRRERCLRPRGAVGLFAAAAALAAGCAMFYNRPATPIHDAAWRGDIDQIRALVREGANINVEDAVGMMPLYLVLHFPKTLFQYRDRCFDIGRSLDTGNTSEANPT